MDWKRRLQVPDTLNGDNGVLLRPEPIFAWRPRRQRGRPSPAPALLVGPDWKSCNIVSCEVECISYSRFRQRVSRSRRLEERLKEAETTRFNLRHEQALEAIMAAGERNWMANA